MWRLLREDGMVAKAPGRGSNTCYKILVIMSLKKEDRLGCRFCENHWNMLS